MHVVTSDLGEAIAAVAGIYCPHEVKIMGSNRGIQAALESHPGSRSQMVSLSYAAPVKIDAGTFENLLLFMSCSEGAALATQGRASARWSSGQTLPLSPNLSSQLEFDRSFRQDSIRLDMRFVEVVCSQLIGRPLDRPLQFQLAPFRPVLEQVWKQAVDMRRLLHSIHLPLDSATQQRLDEMLATLVLEWHPHNHSEFLKRETAPIAPRTVREAERIMRAAGPGITMDEVARELRISLRSLQMGFRQARQSTPSRTYREIRLNAARQDLLQADEATTVTSVALKHGFSHLARFSGYYRAMFDEAPGMTLRRNRR